MAKAGPILAEGIARVASVWRMLWIALPLVSLLSTAPAFAQSSDEDARAVARQLGERGLKAYREGHYEQALDQLSRAYSALRAPSLGLWTARVMVALGKLVEASERYLEVTQLAAVGRDLSLQEEAKQVAEQERQALLPRLGQLKVEVGGAPASEVEVTLDGAGVPASSLGTARPANPGQHLAKARYAGREATEQVTLAEGESKSVLLRFAAASPPPPQASGGPAEGIVPPTSPAPAGGIGADAPAGGSQRTWGWIGIGVGGAGLALGTVTGIMVLDKKAALDRAGCDPDSHGCSVAQRSAVEDYNALRPVSTAGFIAGLAAAGAGAVLLFTAPRGRGTGRLSPWIGPMSTGVTGSF